MRCPARPTVKRLAGWPILITHAAAVVIRLRHAGFNVSARRNDVGLDSPIAAQRVDGSATRETDDVVRAIGAGISDAAAVGSGLSNILAGTDTDDILGRSRTADGIRA